ncbi:MAG: hypothetical protein WBA63_14085 [Thermomicrobiales bacterium]
MRQSFVKLRLLAILAMTVGLMAGSSLAASAAPSAPAGGHAASYQSADTCSALITANLIDPTTGEIVDLDTFETQALALGITQSEIDLVLLNGCDVAPEPTVEPTLEPTLEPTAAVTVQPGEGDKTPEGGIPPTQVPTTVPTVAPTEVPSTTSSITISAFLSDQVAYPQFLVSAPFSAQAASDVGGSIPADRTFELYVNGDTTAAPFAVVSTGGGAAVVDGVPEGLVTIYETQSGASIDVNVVSGNITSVTFLAPSGAGAGNSDIASIVIDTYGCDQIDVPVAATGSTGGVLPAAVEQNDLPNAGCTPIDRDLVLYLNGDTTAQPWASFSTVDGVAALNEVPTGDHLLVDPATGYQFPVSAAAGTVTAISLYFPIDDVIIPTQVAPTATAAPGQPTAVPGGDHGHGHDHGNKGTTGKSTSGSSSVSSLPNTGQGSSSSTDTSTLVLLFGALSLGALAGGVAWRQRRSA